MPQFTKEADYGLQLITALAKLEKGDLLSLRKFSKESNISFLFLQRIAKKLREAGLIRSTKGACGGYCLNKNPQKISIIEIVESLEGECAVMDCLKKDCCCGCGKEDTCPSKKIFASINKELVGYLTKTKLSDLLDN